MATKPTTGGTTQTISQVFQGKHLWAWWTQNGGRGTNAWNGTTEKGMDYSAAYGTPIGVPVGGKIISIENSHLPGVNNIVMMQDASGATWLYQHITATVRVGQTLGAGSVIGTENGLPVSQYSTAPHIEVRYLPAGSFQPGVNSWFQNWVNPFGIFSSLSNQTAGTVGNGTGPGSGGGGVTGPGQGITTDGSVLPPATGLPGTYIPLLAQVHFTLVSNPGLYGMCLAIDEAEEFPGYIDLSVNGGQTTNAINIPTPIPGVTIPTGITVPVYDIVGIARSIGATATDNAIPFAIRSSLITAGALLVFSLVAKAIAPVVKGAVDIAKVAGG